MRNGKFYTIGIVSELLGVTQQTVRMYEERGFVNPARSEANQRLYTEKDLENLQLICKLSRDMGVNLAGIEIILRLRDQMNSLQSEREHLIKLLYEAGEMIQGLLDNQQVTPGLIKSSLGQLIKILDI